MSEDKRQSLVVSKMTDEFEKIPKVIETEDDVLAATDLILKIRKVFNDIEAKMVERTGPASETIKLIKQDFKKFLDPLATAEATLKKSIEEYANKVVQKDLARLETLKEETGDDTLSLQIGFKSLPSEHGDLKFRKKYAINIVDEKAIPRKFWIKTIDMKGIQQLIEDSEGLAKIPGVEAVQTQSASLYVK